MKTLEKSKKKRREYFVRATSPKKYSMKDLPQLRRKLWAQLAPLIKRRDGGKCISCPADGLEGIFQHAGHLFSSGGHGSVRYHPRNIATQCRRCNIFLHGNGPDYAKAFMARYGVKFFEDMFLKSKEMKKWTPPEIAVLIQKTLEGIDAYTEFYESEYGPALTAAS